MPDHAAAKLPTRRARPRLLIERNAGDGGRSKLGGFRTRTEMSMKRQLVAWLAGSLWAASALAQPAGIGPGMMGSGPGVGPGGYGPGGCGAGPGMMWGEGAGPGTGGYGMGPGFGIGPGMMGGFGRLNVQGLDLSDDQRAKLAEIHTEVERKQWDLMRSMHELGWQSAGGRRGGDFDAAEARKTYDAMAALRKQMFDNMLDARQRIDALLTPPQRQQLRRAWGGQ
jgi:Spy/CpxP family protein refolding chaperone